MALDYRALAYLFFFSSRRRHTSCSRDWSSDVCSSDLLAAVRAKTEAEKASFLQMEAEFKRLLAAMKAEFLKAEAELVEAIEARKLAVSDATRLAADIVEKAKLEGVAIISGAKTKATELLKAGDAEAQTREQEAESRITEARGTLGAVELEITDANARLSGIRTAIARYAAE